ncbi:MAG TPA: discoidin domain-containing protein [Pseudonocardiaceae bacterium]|nr:discoidin domain-containing protein [Pseudonocardiaceae bacterium]
MTTPASAAPAASANLALNKTMTASSSAPGDAASNAADGNQGSYWQSDGSKLPQWLQADLGRTTAIGQVVLKLPSGWTTRSETLSVLGSTDGANFATIATAKAYKFNGTANTVNINFGATSARYVRVNVTGNTGQQAGQVSEFQVLAPAASPTNLALGKTATASSNTQNYVAGNATDGNQASYWESNNNAFPQWLQVDLGSSVSVNQIVLTLPTANWGARTETLSVLDSPDNTNFATIVNSTGYNFDGTTNTVTINIGQTTTRYLRLNFTANTGWPAGQLSELQVFAA